MWTKPVFWVKYMQYKLFWKSNLILFQKPITDIYFYMLTIQKILIIVVIGLTVYVGFLKADKI